MAEHSHEFFLYRVTLHPGRPLLAKAARLDDKPGLLRAAVREEPLAEARGRTRWKIGNIEDVGDDALYFRIWRPGKMLVALADSAGNVVERLLETAPNTHVLLDLRNQVCAIAKAPKLAAHPDSIARGFERLLNATRTIEDHLAEVVVTAIKDPTEFLEQLRGAYRVRSLWVEEQRPNPFDTKGLAKNLSEAVETVRAEKAKVQFTGEDLDATRPEVEELVRVTNTAGGNAGARIEPTERSRGTVGISLRAKFAKLRRVLDLSDEAARKELLSEVRETYRRLRDRE